MLSQMPLPPSGNVNDAYFYVEAPWIKDLSKYNMNVDGSMYMDIDKYNGKYVFSMGRVGAYNSYIKFDNDSNILPCPQPDNEISIEALLYSCRILNNVLGIISYNGILNQLKE